MARRALAAVWLAWCAVAGCGDGGTDPPGDAGTADTQAADESGATVEPGDGDAPGAATCAYTCVPHAELAPGDPEEGRDKLLNGRYMSCGIPSRVVDQVTGWLIAGPTLEGRTGSNATLPYNYSATVAASGVEVVNLNCLSCHASTFDGEVVIGLGHNIGTNSTQAQAPLVEVATFLTNSAEEDYELDRFLRSVEIADTYPMDTAGVSRGDWLVLAYAAWHDPVTQEWLDTPHELVPKGPPVPMDVPAWWRMKKKSAMFANMAIAGDWSVWALNESFACHEDAEEVEDIHADGADIRAFIQSLEPPAWPGEVDAPRVEQGRGIFEATCAWCHGTYGDDWTYPNLVVPLEVIGTDPTMAELAPLWNDTWDEVLAPGPWSDDGRVLWHAHEGYVAPPLDGVWITGPYLHNGSVPTIEQLLDSSSRPTYWRRLSQENTTGTFDFERVGWQHEVLDHGKDGAAGPEEAVLVYDTTLEGFSNGGHTFGDGLSGAERAAVIEYLKTL